MTDTWTEQQLQQFVHLREGFIKTGFARDVAEAQARRAMEARRARPERVHDPAHPTKDDLYREAMQHRQAAVADSRLIRLSPKEAGSNFDGVDR